MVDVPERIWAYHNGNSQTYLTAQNKFHNVEYVRADLFATLEAEVSRLTALVDEAKGMARPFSSMAGEMFARGWDASNVAIALDNPDDPHRVTAGDFFAARAFAEKAGA